MTSKSTRLDAKQQILQLMPVGQEQYVSGEQLSEQLNCSRTAVWKHIQQLKKQGYVFEAVPRLGYRLLQHPSRFDLTDYQNRLTTQRLGRPVYLYESVDSTQNKAREHISEGAAEGTLIIAEEQRSGRGRAGRKWHSPAGKGVWMSLILKPQIPLLFTPQLTLLTAVALCRTIKQVTGIQTGIKWPNDLLVNGRKLSGILLESVAEEQQLNYVIAGVGISVNLETDDFPAELHEVATSLKIESGRETNREQLVCHFLDQFEHLYGLYCTEGFEPIRLMWEANSITLQRIVHVASPQGVINGTALGLDEYGALQLRVADGSIVKVYAGDVHLPGTTS